MTRLVYPITPKEMGDTHELSEEECKRCNVQAYLRREYCDIGICAKEELENTRGER